MAKRVVRACLITNPRSGRGGIDLAEPLETLQAHGWDVSVRQKTHGGQATELARQAVRAGYDVVVNGGGDGTLSEIIDGVMGSAVAVGSLPGGTANLWAREVGISSRLRVAALQLASAERRNVDVGHVTINGRHGQYFMLMAGLGFDGATLEHVSKLLKNLIGPAAVGLAAVQALPSFRATSVLVTLNDIEWEGRVSQIVIGNTRRYGAFTRVTPAAFIDDGQLDVCLMTATNLLSAGRQLSALALRQRPSPTSAETYRASSVTVRAAQPLPLEVDGSSVTMKHVRPTKDGVVYAFSVVAQGVTMLLPRAYDNDLFQSAPQLDALLPHSFASVALGQAAPAPPEPARTPVDGHDPRRHAERTPKKGKKQRDRLMKVLVVGPSALTVAQVRTGQVYTVLIEDSTKIKRQSDGVRLRWEEAAPLLTEGDLALVKGKRDRERDVIAAKQVIVGVAAPLATADA